MECAKELSPLCSGQRSRLIVDPLKDALVNLGMNEDDAMTGAKSIAEALAKLDTDAEKKIDVRQVKTLYFTSPGEIKALAEAYQKENAGKKALKAVTADILRYRRFFRYSETELCVTARQIS